MLVIEDKINYSKFIFILLHFFLSSYNLLIANKVFKRFKQNNRFYLRN